MRSGGLFLPSKMQLLSFDTPTNSQNCSGECRLPCCMHSADVAELCLTEMIHCSASGRSSLWLSELCSNSDFKPIPSSWPSSPRRTWTSCFCKARPQGHVPSSSRAIPAQNPHLTFPGILVYQNSAKSSFPFAQSTSCCYEPQPQSWDRKFMSPPPTKQPPQRLTRVPPLTFGARTQMPKPSPSSLWLQPARSEHGPQRFVSSFPLSVPSGPGFLLSTSWLPITKHSRKENSLKHVSSVCSYSQWYCWKPLGTGCCHDDPATCSSCAPENEL